MANKEKKIFQGPGEAQRFRGAGFRLMKEGNFAEALSQYEKFRAAYPGPQLDQVGICLWRLGEYQAACEDWVFENERFDRNETTELEFGGVTVPSLLWWASSHLDLPEHNRYHEIAIKALKRRMKLRRTQQSGWPAACAQYLLGDASEQPMFQANEERLQKATENALKEAARIMGERVPLPEYAQEDLDQSRKWGLLQTYFYIGAKALFERKIARYKEMLNLCLENVPPKTPPPEYFLAPYELQRIASGEI
jgi:tetratricopeptide (TPR) repeat protein